MCGSNKVKLPPAPTLATYNFTPFDVANLKLLDPAAADAQGAAQDAAYYARSDADYNTRNPGVLAANSQVGGDIAREATGSLPPIVQNALATTGLSSALGTFGDIAAGSAGLYGIGRNLGVGALNYADSRRKALSDFFAANPERSFGLNGTDQLNLQLGNLGQQNAVDVSNNAGLNAVNAANVQAQNAINQQAYAAGVQKAIADARPTGFGSAVGGLLGTVASFVPGVKGLIKPLDGYKIGSGLGGAFG